MRRPHSKLSLPLLLLLAAGSRPAGVEGSVPAAPAKNHDSIPPVSRCHPFFAIERALDTAAQPCHSRCQPFFAVRDVRPQANQFVREFESPGSVL